MLADDPTFEWVPPGQPLFEAVREDVAARVRDDLQHGTVFYDLHSQTPYLLDVFSASVKDGRGNQLHRRLFVVQTELDGTQSVKQPTSFLALSVAPQGTKAPAADHLLDRNATAQFLLEKALNPFLAEIAEQRARETETIARHLRN